MKKQGEQITGVIGLECGGTRTTAVYLEGERLSEWKCGPANLRLLTDRQLDAHFKTVAAMFPTPAAVGIGMAGARTAADRGRILRAAAKAWPAAHCHATNDLETALAAAAPEPEPGGHERVRVLVLSGTGSCCYGKGRGGRTAKSGGWGHILGDAGSGYQIAHAALREVVRAFDAVQKTPVLGRRFLRTLQVNELNDLVAWVQEAPKAEVAALALDVFACAAKGDTLSRRILDSAAAALAHDASICASRLVKHGEIIQFVFAGGVLVNQPRFVKAIRNLLQCTWPNAEFILLARSGAIGAARMAGASLASLSSTAASAAAPLPPLPVSTRLSPTEERHPMSFRFHELPISEAIDLMLDDVETVPAAVRRETDALVKVTGWVAAALKRGGRLFYSGAGTSGRLGILDASECPPTFRADPEQVQGIIAGGRLAIWQAVEGAEDDYDAGARAIRSRGLTRSDVLIGIAASGRTPFVWGSLFEAKMRGAKTVLLTFNPHLSLTKAIRTDAVIAPNTGPEVLTGSTRLKAGTATKIILNLITTVAMAKAGKVISNLMVDLNPSNVKLRDRAVRIVQELSGTSASEAEAALRRSGWVIKKAWHLLKRRAP